MVALFSVPQEAEPPRRSRSRLKIIDYRKHLNKRFKKVHRASTRYIIVHTSEAGLSSTLRTLSRGKSMGRYRTVGGHSHYAIARDGRVYRILSHNIRADHAGLSMWNGVEDISSHSLGIELVGFHYGSITSQQYHSLSLLLNQLQRLYKIKDKNVLTHSQVSYGRPNIWFKRSHRGRKRCALNFERERAGLKDAWHYDPDVRKGRLLRDHHIYAMFYKRKPRKVTNKEPEEVQTAAVAQTQPPVTTSPPVNATGSGQEPALPKTSTPSNPTGEAPTTAVSTGVAESGAITVNLKSVNNVSNIISKLNTAWNIAGEDYDDSTTLYILPDNRRVRGDQLGNLIGWNNIPRGTTVLVNQSPELQEKKGPIFTITREFTAWSFAQRDYRKHSTFYFLPDGRVRSGNRMSDWDDLPNGTRMIIGYKGPISIRNVRGQTPWGIAGRAHNSPETIYLIPGIGLRTGDEVKDFSDLPRGASLFLKIM